MTNLFNMRPSTNYDYKHNDMNETLLINTYIFGGWGWRWWQDIDKHMYNMYITINIKSTTGILTAINVSDIQMIWEKFLTEF